ncbi:ribosomal-processing cysteine protease Prp [Paenibacillus alkalitolerans]|uniref:ribosomal-processing cysteine protease Prp n=1 Tax=Paenibacillus alkalitolerans TaxID=2799335 RepID=UPI0018F2B988|nr:ribosomal-processing cysteine protease Prp [Paenibacillus alkalitolerans]
MIRVNIRRDRASNVIRGFKAEGHALFDESGRDIVCAGVSAVTVGAVNAAEAVAGVKLDAVTDRGILHVGVPEGLPDETGKSLQIVLESMVVMLKSIEDSYGEYIRVTDRFV